MKKWLGGLLLVAVCAFGGDTLPLRSRTGSQTSPAPEKSIVKPPGGFGVSQGLPDSAPPLGASEDSPTAKEAPGGIPQPYIASVDVYGSSRVNEATLRETLGSDLDSWLAKGLKGDPTAQEMEQKLADKIKTKFGFASAEWSIVQYFEGSDLAIHITLDVMEKDDVKKRSPFKTAPSKDLKDPGGLLKAWLEYEETAMELIETGQLEPESEDCKGVAFHCPFGHKHPKLKKYQATFVDGVKKFQKDLLDVQANDRKPDNRASATYLLAYMKDGKRVVNAMLDRVTDPEALVRNNALRVLGDIAEFHPDLLIPIKPLLEALTFPRVSDRSKAVYVTYLLALNSQQVRDEIKKSAVPTLLQLMGCKQPDHRDIAHGLLRKLSGKEFAATDLQSWRSWYASSAKERGVSTNAGGAEKPGASTK